MTAPIESSHSVSRRRQTAPESRGSKFQILKSWYKRGQRKVTRLAGMEKTVRGVLQRRDGSGSQRYERAVLNARCVAPSREVGRGDKQSRLIVGTGALGRTLPQGRSVHGRDRWDSSGTGSTEQSLRSREPRRSLIGGSVFTSSTYRSTRCDQKFRD